MWDLDNPGKVYEWLKLKKELVFKRFFNFCNILKMREKILWNPQTFFLIVQSKRYSQIKPQLKVEIEDGREAPKKPILIFS